jgi:murein DD-endopeptidase MepM/ murein hydrolase activator NlpD
MTVFAVNAEVLYRVPWAEGLSFTISQAPGDVVTTHIAARTREAVDFGMPEGTSVLAARSGVVIETEARFGAAKDEDPVTHEGNFVRVRHEDGTIATYAHLKHRGVAVAKDERIEAGRLLGYSGATGDTNGAQLHFAVTRVQNGYEVSVPVRFTIGAPPIAFEPRRSLVVTANYKGPADYPRAASDYRFGLWKRPELPPEEMPKVWLTLAGLAAALVAGIVWFWKFSRG